MNRREFTRGLLSLSALPKLPVAALAAGSGTAAAASSTASATASHMYFMGWYTARTSNAVSPDMLAAQLKVSPDVAQEIFGKLVANRTVTPPDAMGLSRALDPLPKIRSATSSLSRTVRNKVQDKAGEAVEKVKQRVTEAAQTEEREGQAVRVAEPESAPKEAPMPQGTVAQPAPLPHGGTHDKSD